MIDFQLFMKNYFLIYKKSYSNNTQIEVCPIVFEKIIHLRAKKVMSKIWKHPISLTILNSSPSKETLVQHVGIEFTEFGDDYLIAKMPVDHRTRQPMGLLHGGANVVLAETLGSVASVFCIEDIQKQVPVGLEVNANHLRGVREGWVYGKVTPIRIGRTTHVWEINITDDQGRHTCVSRITIAVIDRRQS